MNCCGLFSLAILLLQADSKIDSFLEKYPGVIYQDIVIQNKIYEIGTEFCDSRYELLKPVLDLYERPFSVLDLGAAQGYFTFRIAQDYPLSSCLMIEANDTPYVHHGDMLYELSTLNNHLNNISYLREKMNFKELTDLQLNHHFDVAIAFLVVHQIDDSLLEQIKIIEILLKLSDNLILEIANDVAMSYSAYIEILANKLNCQYMGEVKRHKDPNVGGTGKIFWFKQSSIN